MTTTMLTTAEAARIYGIPERTIRRWADEGRLTVLTVAGRKWYRMAEIRELAITLHRYVPEPRHASEQ